MDFTATQNEHHAVEGYTIFTVVSSLPVQLSRHSDQLLAERFVAGIENCIIFPCVQTISGANLASYLMGRGTVSHGVKRPEREADHTSIWH
jgi:hypothetical protein